MIWNNYLLKGVRSILLNFEQFTSNITLVNAAEHKMMIRTGNWQVNGIMERGKVKEFRSRKEFYVYEKHICKWSGR